jgi:hypothetical protein
MTYFKQLTGSKLPKKEKFTINYNGKTHIGNMYRVVDKNGNKFTFHLKAFLGLGKILLWLL